MPRDALAQRPMERLGLEIREPDCFESSDASDAPPAAPHLAEGVGREVCSSPFAIVTFRAKGRGSAIQRVD